GLFSTWITTGTTLFYLKTARGLPADISNIFAGGPYYLRVLGGTALFALGLFAIFAAFVLPCGLIGLAFDPAIGMIGIMVGGVLAMVPMAIFHYTFFPFFYLIIDRNMGIIESFAAARDITPGNRLIVFLIVLVVGLVGSAINQATCNLGVLVVVPFTMLLYPVIYLLLIGHPTAGRHAPNPAQPNRE
ncbi:MAG TPA: hypothetical protein DD670_06405, partial [Planctomycetaceae bacterium]|nr:hypothetical protein [Planctomycetaceae bacterium]